MESEIGLSSLYNIWFKVAYGFQGPHVRALKKIRPSNLPDIDVKYDNRYLRQFAKFMGFNDLSYYRFFPDTQDRGINMPDTNLKFDNEPYSLKLVKEMVCGPARPYAGVFLRKYVHNLIITKYSSFYDLRMLNLLEPDYLHKRRENEVEIKPDHIPSINIVADAIWNQRVRKKGISQSDLAYECSKVVLELSHGKSENFAIRTIGMAESGKLIPEERTLFVILKALDSTHLLKDKEFIDGYMKLHCPDLDKKKQPLTYALARARTKIGMSLQDVGRELGVQGTSVSKWEWARRVPSAEYKKKYLDLLHMPEQVYEKLYKRQTAKAGTNPGHAEKIVMEKSSESETAVAA